MINWFSFVIRFDVDDSKIWVVGQTLVGSRSFVEWSCENRFGQWSGLGLMCRRLSSEIVWADTRKEILDCGLNDSTVGTITHYRLFTLMCRRLLSEVGSWFELRLIWHIIEDWKLIQRASFVNGVFFGLDSLRCPVSRLCWWTLMVRGSACWKTARFVQWCLGTWYLLNCGLGWFSVTGWHGRPCAKDGRALSYRPSREIMNS
jgi:hypothetical protein